MVISVIILRKAFAPKSTGKQTNTSSDNTFVAEYQVSNPAIFGKTIMEIRQGADCQFVISRIWKNETLIIPTSETILEEGEHMLVISGKKDVEKIKTLFGHKEDVDWNKKGIDWNAIDSQLVSRKVLVTKPEHNGVKLGDLRLRNSYGINITRVNRAGIDLLPSRNLRLQMGDKLVIVGEARSVENVSRILGNESRQLKNPNLLSMFIGIILGLILGSIPIALPGISMPVKLGIAGGPIIVGILMGAFGPRFHITTYTTQSANLMLRQLGLTIYLAGLGLSAGAGFFETVFTLQGLKWVAISIVLCVVPVLLTGFISAKVFKISYADNVGMLCGGMANPFALDYAGSGADGDDPAVAYATVYPAGIFLRVISAQIIIILLG
jgi:AspT/YidE/YbjL antiporter-like protein